MTKITIPFDTHTLTIHQESTHLQFHLSPSHSSDHAYLYQAKIDSSSLDAIFILKLLFSTIDNLWVYLQFHNAKAISIDHSKIVQDTKLLKDGHQPSSDLKEVELPIAIKLIMLENIGTEVKLQGYCLLQSPEVRLQKKDIEISTLKKQLESLKNRYQDLEKENAQLKAQLQNQENGISQHSAQVLPKKRVHISEDFKQDPSKNCPLPKVAEQTKKKLVEPSKEQFNLSQESSSPSQSNNSELEEKIDSLPSNSSSKRSKRTKKNQVTDEESRIVENEQENLRNPPEMVMDKTFEDDYFEQNSYSMPNDSFNFKRKIPTSRDQEKLQESDQAKLIESFSSKCLTEVGYNDKGEAKTGYICVFCEKIFKQPEFLSKHIFTRHQEVLESHVTETFLMGKLNAYRLSREVANQAHLRNKKMEKLKNGMMENGR